MQVSTGLQAGAVYIDFGVVTSTFGAEDLTLLYGMLFVNA